MKELKIALVKQEVYQDLYVWSKSEANKAEILFSSIMRVGPFGLINELNADFYILKEEYSKETQIYKKVLPHRKNVLHLLKSQQINTIPGWEHHSPGSPYPNGEFAIHEQTVDWSQYDIVISINICLTKKLVKKFPKTLFCYMIGEANLATHRAKFGYDVSLNQLAGGAADYDNGVIDFPYTFLSGNTLEKVLKKELKHLSDKNGIYIEINSCKERPVVNIPEPFKLIEKKTGIRMLLHEQNIKANLIQLYKAKFYVKYEGRKTRGNGAIEAISAGTIVIMQPHKIIHSEILTEETQFQTIEELIQKLNWLNNDHFAYQRVLTHQRKIVDELFFNEPLKSLVGFLDKKRNNQLYYKTWVNQIKFETYDKISNFFNRLTKLIKMRRRSL